MINIYTYITKIPIRTLFLLGVGVFVYHFFHPCNVSLFCVLLWSLVASLGINKEIEKYKFSKCVIILVMLINVILSIYYFVKRNTPIYGIKCIGYYHGSNYYKNYEYHYYISYYDGDDNQQYITINHNEPDRWKSGNCFLIFVHNDNGKIISDKPSAIDFEKYKYPVTCISDKIEVGNDSYEYAKYSPDIAYNSFGLTIVLKATTYDSNFISFYDLHYKFQHLTKERSDKDTFLVYSNINHSFFDGWHICPDSLDTPENIAKVDSAGYGYIFRGKIYSAAETEKYWNIIKQYKLRNH